MAAGKVREDLGSGQLPVRAWCVCEGRWCAHGVPVL